MRQKFVILSAHRITNHIIPLLFWTMTRKARSMHSIAFASSSTSALQKSCLLSMNSSPKTNSTQDHVAYMQPCVLMKILFCTHEYSWT